MKVSDLFSVKIITEAELLAEPLMEMANLNPYETGTGLFIFVGKVGGARHDPRVKVSNNRRHYDKSDTFLIKVQRPAVIETPKSVRVNRSEKENALDWVDLNYDTLMKLYRAFETETDDIPTLLNQLKRI